MIMHKNILIIVVSFCLCASTFGATWTGTHWDADELPQDFMGETIFSTVGGGSEAVFAADNPAHPWGGGFSVYRQIAITGAYGFWKTTKAGVWDDTDTTIEFRLKIDAFLDGKDTVMVLTVSNATEGFTAGVRFGKLFSTYRVYSYESSAKYMNFDHTAEFFTYRLLVDVSAQEGRIYYWNESISQWIHMTTSSWINAPTTSAMNWGDPSGSYAGRFGVDYVYWTHDGLFLDGPLFCGSQGTQYHEYDFNSDCYVDIQDFALVVNDWLECTDPLDSRCDEFWSGLEL